MNMISGKNALHALLAVSLTLNGMPLAAAGKKNIKTKIKHQQIEVPPPPPIEEEAPPPPPTEVESLTPLKSTPKEIPLNVLNQWFKAARNGDLDTVKKLDAKYMDLLNKKDIFNNPALLQALFIRDSDQKGLESEQLATLRKNKEDVVRFLLEHEADITAVNTSGSNALIIAAESGFSPKTLQTLIHAGIPITSKSFFW